MQSSRDNLGLERDSGCDISGLLEELGDSNMHAVEIHLPDLVGRSSFCLEDSDPLVLLTPSF